MRRFLGSVRAELAHMVHDIVSPWWGVATPRLSDEMYIQHGGSGKDHRIDRGEIKNIHADPFYFRYRESNPELPRDNNNI